MQQIIPTLMFTGQAEKALNFYTSLFSNSSLDSIQYYGAEVPERKGTVKMALCTLAGIPYRFIDSPPVHGFGFTPAISLMVQCTTALEVDELYTALADGGLVLMPLQEYPFSPRYAWVTDRFGVSWQLSFKPDSQ